MADTIIGSANAATKKLWSVKTLREASKLIYWQKFMPGGVLDIGKTMRGDQKTLNADESNAPIMVKGDLLKEKGDVIKYSLIMRLTGGGVVGDAELWDNEEELLHYEDEVSINQYGNAVRPQGRMTERRTAWDIRAAAKSGLAVWLAEKWDQDIFTELDSSPTKTFWGSTATGTADMESTFLLTLALLSKVKAYAKKSPGVPRMEPIKVDGKDYYLVIISPDQEYDLRVNDTNWATAQREANVRGSDNPIFAGGAGIWDDMIIHSHPDIAIATNWGAGANVAGASAMFLGKNALTLGLGALPKWEEETRNYGNKKGIALWAQYGVKKNVFNALDYAMISIKTARTNIT